MYNVTNEILAVSFTKVRLDEDLRRGAHYANHLTTL
jgi:hypothetical protein